MLFSNYVKVIFWDYIICYLKFKKKKKMKIKFIFNQYQCNSLERNSNKNFQWIKRATCTIQSLKTKLILHFL